MGIDLLLEPQPAVDVVEMIHRRQEITLNDIKHLLLCQVLSLPAALVTAQHSRYAVITAGSYYSCQMSEIRGLEETKVLLIPQNVLIYINSIIHNLSPPSLTQ